MINSITTTKAKEKMKPNSFDSTLARPKFVVHDYSHTISKQKPKIRIIHIVEPQIIKTDVQNFQELVQRLTGKPVEKKGCMNKAKKASSLFLHSKPYCSKPGSRIESMSAPIVKKEIEEMYDADNQNDLFGFLDELEGFLDDMNEFPLLSYRSSQISNICEMPLY